MEEAATESEQESERDKGQVKDSDVRRMEKIEKGRREGLRLHSKVAEQTAPPVAHCSRASAEREREREKAEEEKSEATVSPRRE